MGTCTSTPTHDYTTTFPTAPIVPADAGWKKEKEDGERISNENSPSHPTVPTEPSSPHASTRLQASLSPSLSPLYEGRNEERRKENIMQWGNDRMTKDMQALVSNPPPPPSNAPLPPPPIPPGSKRIHMQARLCIQLPIKAQAQLMGAAAFPLVEQPHSARTPGHSARRPAPSHAIPRPPAHSSGIQQPLSTLVVGDGHSGPDASPRTAAYVHTPCADKCAGYISGTYASLPSSSPTLDNLQICTLLHCILCKKNVKYYEDVRLDMNASAIGKPLRRRLLPAAGVRVYSCTCISHNVIDAILAKELYKGWECAGGHGREEEKDVERREREEEEQIHSLTSATL